MDNKIHNQAEKYFGITDDPNVAGYMTPNGNMLDFSGERFGGGNGTRYMDHNEISYLLDVDYPKVAYMKLGGIRLSPEAHGFECKVKPTAQQYSTLRIYLDEFSNYTRHVDLYDPEENTNFNKSYEADRPTDRIINDIKRFYAGEYNEDETDFYEKKSIKLKQFIPLFEDFTNKTQRFKLSPEKYKEMYDSVYLGIEEDSAEITNAKNILWNLNDKNYYITKDEYDIIQKIIKNDNIKKGKHYVEYGNDVIPMRDPTIKRFNQEEKPQPSIDVKPIIFNYTEFIPVSAMEGFWKKLTTTDHLLKQFIDLLFNNIQKRPTVTNNDKICYPVTSREMSVLNDFKEGRLNPRNFPATY
jgi:hypothetical protein